MDILITVVAVVLVIIVLWMIAIGDLMSRPDEDFPGKSDKLCWVIVLTFTGIFGLIVYMICGPSQSSAPIAEGDIHRAELGCLQCGARIPAGSDKCPECGWSYRDS